MNFNYGYNVKAAQPLQAKQVEKVKEEVVEKKEAEVKADAPKYEVVTGDADKILADINKATVKGAGGVEGSDRGGDPNSIYELIESYKRDIERYNNPIFNQNPMVRMKLISEILGKITRIVNLPEFEEQMESLKESITNDFVTWYTKANYWAEGAILNASYYGGEHLVGGGTMLDSGLNTFLNISKYLCSNNPEGSQNPIIGLISQYTNVNVSDLLTEKLEIGLNFADACNGDFSHLSGGGANAETYIMLYNTLSELMEINKTESQSGSVTSRMEAFNSIDNYLCRIINANGFNINNPYIDALREEVLSDYIANNAECDAFVVELTDELDSIIINGGAHEEGLDLVTLISTFEIINDTPEDYDSIYSQLTPAQNTEFFTSKVDANKHVLSSLSTLLESGILRDKQTIEQVQVLRNKFEMLLDVSKQKLDEAQEATNAQ